MDLFDLSNVAKTYRRGGEDILIFDRLDLRIPEGDFVAIMGPSGSGKTTLLNLLGGIDRASAGSIAFRGNDIAGLGESSLSAWRARNVGIVFQFYNLIPVLSAARNVALPLLLTNLGRKARAARVATALARVGLSDRAGHLPRELSGGQQQRVAIARAIVADPAILLCDEPTGDLDRSMADEILGLLTLLNAQMGKAIVMVTHDPSAAKFASRTLHLDKGVFAERELQHG